MKVKQSECVMAMLRLALFKKTNCIRKMREQKKTAQVCSSGEVKLHTERCSHVATEAAFPLNTSV